jgi:hypothetical protein
MPGLLKSTGRPLLEETTIGSRDRRDDPAFDRKEKGKRFGRCSSAYDALPIHF